MIKYIMDLIMIGAGFILIMNGIAGNSVEPLFMIILGALIMMEIATDYLFHHH